MNNEDRNIIWGCVRETTLVTCRFHPQRAGDAIIEMLGAYKRLYPEKFPQPFVACFIDIKSALLFKNDTQFREIVLKMLKAKQDA